MASNNEILIINDNKALIDHLGSVLKKSHFNTFSVFTATKGLELAISGSYRLIFYDLNLRDLNCSEFISRLSAARVSAPVILTGTPSKLADSIRCRRSGAAGFIDDLLNPELIQFVVDDTLKSRNITSRMDNIRLALADQFRFVGGSAIIVGFRNKLRRLGRLSSNVLFSGDPGTGKQRAAKFVHYNSARAVYPFEIVDCAMTSPERPDSYLKLEAELFGYRKNVFVGANEDTKGKLETADKGSIYLKNIECLTREMQLKLLKFAETGVVVQIGSNNEKKVDSRFMAGTRVKLEEIVKAGRFSEDLYFALSSNPVRVPSLAEYAGDIPELAYYFLENIGKSGLEISEDAIGYLKQLKYPENVRQIKELVERLGSRCRNGVIDRDLLVSVSVGVDYSPVEIFDSKPPATGDTSGSQLFRQDVPYRKQLIDLETRLLSEVYDLSQGNITRAASMLQTDRGNLSKKLSKLGIKKDDS